VFALLQGISPLLHAHVGSVGTPEDGLHLHLPGLKAADCSAQAIGLATTRGESAVVEPGEEFRRDAAAPPSGTRNRQVVLRPAAIVSARVAARDAAAQPLPAAPPFDRPPLRAPPLHAA
ncbi:MAG TPA: hypothetical protein VGP22_12670, partial [Albitalea sp.]|nr:hypothetical protein [Albitalea sp.]